MRSDLISQSDSLKQKIRSQFKANTSPTHHCVETIKNRQIQSSEMKIFELLLREVSLTLLTPLNVLKKPTDHGYWMDWKIKPRRNMINVTPIEMQATEIPHQKARINLYQSCALGLITGLLLGWWLL